MSATSTMHLIIQGNASGLVAATRAGGQGLQNLNNQARAASDGLQVMGGDSTRAATGLDLFGAAANVAAQRAARFAHAASSSLRTAGRAVAWGSEKVVNQWTAMAGGFGLAMAAKDAMTYKHALNMVAITAMDAKGQVDGMSKSSWLAKTDEEVRRISSATGIMKEDIVAGIDAIKSRTGNLAQATTQMELLAKTAVATGSSVQDVFAIAANLEDKGGIKTVEGMSQAFTILNEAGKAGAFEFKDFATNSEELFAIMSLYGKMDIQGLKSFSAMAQMARKSTGSSADATTAVKRFGAFMADTGKVEKALAKQGIRVKLDSKASVETNTKKIAEVAGKKFGDQALKRIIASQAFGEEGIKVMTSFMNEYMAGRGFKLFDSLKEAGGELDKNTNLARQFLEASTDAVGQWNKLRATLSNISSELMDSVAMDGLTKAMAWINEHGVETRQIVIGITAALGAMAAIVAGMKLVSLIDDFNRAIGRGRYSGAGGGFGGGGGLLGGLGGLGGLGSSPTNPMYVWVVNGGGAGTPGGPLTSLPGGATPPAGGSLLSKIWKRATSRLGLAAIGAGYAAYDEGGDVNYTIRRVGGQQVGATIGGRFFGKPGEVVGQVLGDQAVKMFNDHDRAAPGDATRAAEEELKKIEVGNQRNIGPQRAASDHAIAPPIQLNLYNSIDSKGQVEARLEGAGPGVIALRSESLGPSWVAR